MFEFRKPEFLFQPRQLWRRLHGAPPVDPREEVVTLPWGLPIRVRASEAIGRNVLTHGLYDITVCEVLWRLAEPGEWVLDAGANIGQMTGLLARRVGPTGRVWSFEPHPEVRADLQRHVDTWRTFPSVAPITIHALALADKAGEGHLKVPDHFATNRGLASLTEQAQGLPIQLATLDSLMPSTGSVGVVKMDVEGAEERVLIGGAQTFMAGRVRDVVFEDHDPFPSSVARRLQAWGFEIYSLRAGLFGPVVRAGAEPTLPLRLCDSPSYLATRDPARMRRLLNPRGWQCLRG